MLARSHYYFNMKVPVGANIKLANGNVTGYPAEGSAAPKTICNMEELLYQVRLLSISVPESWDNAHMLSITLLTSCLSCAIQSGPSGKDAMHIVSTFATILQDAFL